MSARISYLIKRVERGIRTELDAVLGPLRVSTPEYTTMSVLSMRGGLSSAQLARRAFVSAQAMHQIIVGLEHHGWLERSADPENGRVLRAELTAEGRKMLALCDRAAAHVERALLIGLSRDQVAVLRHTLETCASSFEQAGTRARRPARVPSAAASSGRKASAVRARAGGGRAR